MKHSAVCKTDGRTEKASSRSTSGMRALVRILPVLLCIVFIFSGCAGTVQSDAGRDELALLIRLGLIDAENADREKDTITRFDAVLALERLLGAGDELRAGDWFNQFKVRRTVDLMAKIDGSQAGAKDKVSAAEAYAMCLKALGVDPAETAAGTNATAETVLTAAQAAGFGRVSGLASASKLTFGGFALILTEFMGLRIPETGETVYRAAAQLDSAFFSLLRNNGCIDDVPETLAPRFDAGFFRFGSFSAFEGSDKRQWSAEYYGIGDSEFEAYEAVLVSLGWQLEGRYISETEPGTVIVLYYKAEASAPEGEMGLALKRTEQGVLSWNLMA